MQNTLTSSSEVKDLNLAGAGRNRIEWASTDMPVLGLIAKRFKKKHLLKGSKYLFVHMSLVKRPI